jgi:hypothetical protein
VLGAGQGGQGAREVRQRGRRMAIGWIGLESERRGKLACWLPGPGAGVGMWMQLQRPPPVFPPYPGRTHEDMVMKLRCMFWRRDWL